MEVFASACAVVLSSVFEGFPLVLNEAMAVGTPFVANGATRTLTGLVTGLNVGENLLEVIDPRGNVQGKGRADADIVLTNYPIEGPVFSGTHEQPFA